MRCPICSQALTGGELVMVCGACHKSFGEGLAVHATGEFRVPTPEMLEVGAAELASTGAVGGSSERVHAMDACAWCGKGEADVKKLLGRNQVALCNECVSLCVDILDAECGNEWR